MKKRVSLFKNIQTTNTVNKKRVLVIDGTNTFKRAAAVSKVTNDHGMHIGAMGGFFMSIGYAIKTISPDIVFISFDGKNSNDKRITMFADYKSNRRKMVKKVIHADLFSTVEEEEAALGHQFKRLAEYFKYIPLHVHYAGGVEADDILAYIVKNQYKDCDNYIMTTDTDYYQLINDSITIYNPRIKTFITPNNAKFIFGLSPNNYLYEKIIDGDAGDGIPGIKGIGKGTIKKHVDILYSNTEIRDIDNLLTELHGLEGKSKAIEKLKNNDDIIKRNYELIQLLDITLPDDELSRLNEAIATAPRLHPIKFMRASIQDGLTLVLKNEPKWLREVFSKVDMNVNK